LSVEIDGPTHLTSGAKDYDLERTEFLRDHEIDEIRFTNEEVYDNILVVLQRIREKIKI